MTYKLNALDKLIEAVEAGDEDFIRGDAWVEAWQMFRPELDKMRSEGTASMIKAMRAYHGSLDAALALHEALLPGWAHLVRSSSHGDGYNYRKGHFFSNVWRDDECPNNGAQCFDTWGATPARAWLLAILRAYRSVQG